MNRFIDPAKLMAANSDAAEKYQSDRRTFLRGGLCALAALGVWMPDLANASAPATMAIKGREMKIITAHPGEKLVGENWHNGKYLPDAFGAIKSVMKDHRSGEVYPIDPRLMDIMYVLQHRLENYHAFEILSGYRSEKTNAKLRGRSRGVARHSLHMTGQACDLELPGTSLSAVRAAAIKLNSGGVGYYPRSDFVHVDTGRVRHW